MSQSGKQKSRLLEALGDIDLQDMLDRQTKALVKRIIGPGDQAVLYGESRAGKSFLALDLGWHIAMGKPWHGRKTTKAPVLYASLEAVQGFRKRMLAIGKTHGDPGPWFRRIKPHTPLARDRGDNQAGSEGMGTILEAARELAAECGQPVGLIVVDTFARAIAGDSENDTADVMHFIEQRAGVIARQTGAAVLTIAHTNRAGDLRGNLHLRNSADVLLRAERDGDGRTLVGEKVKDDGEGPLFDFELQPMVLGQDDDGEEMTSCVVRSRPASPRSERKRETLPVRVFRSAYTVVTLMTDLDAVKLSEVRASFMRAYPANGETDERKLVKRRGKAWERAVANVPSDFSIYAKDGVEYVKPVGTSDPLQEFEVID